MKPENRKVLLGLGITIFTWAIITACGGGSSTQKKWGTAEMIETSNVILAVYPKIAMNSSGHAIAVWEEDNGSFGSSIWSNYYTPGSGWGTAELIGTCNTGDLFWHQVSTPHIAMDSGGNAIAVWDEPGQGMTYSVCTNRYTPGSGWGTAESIETSNAKIRTFPKVAIDTGGNAIAVWKRRDGTQGNIWANRYAPGSGWGTPLQIKINQTGDIYNLQLAMNDSGRAVVVWEEDDGSFVSSIWSHYYTPGSGWGTAGLIETGLHSAKYPQVVINHSGYAIATWEQGGNILTNCYTPGSGWATSVQINVNTMHKASEPQLAMNDSGHAIAIWKQEDSTQSNIWVAEYYTSNSIWSTAKTIETHAGNGEYPQIAINSHGNAIAVWELDDDNPSNIRANHYISGKGWGTAKTIETNIDNAEYPQIAIDDNGNAIAVWDQLYNAEWSIWANSFK